MAQDQLKTIEGSGTQTTTQTPQAAGASSSSTTPEDVLEELVGEIRDDSQKQ